MATEYRRMLLTGPNQGDWEVLEDGERLLSANTGGVGATSDQRADGQQYWERSVDGGPWETFSYWPGARDFYQRSRLILIQRLQNDQRHLLDKAKGLEEVDRVTIEGYKDQIANAQEGLKQALENEKRNKAIARNMERQAKAIEDQIPPLQREADRAAPEPIRESVPA